MPPQALGDGKGTAKAFLEDIASQESEAERSLMHRWVTGKASSLNFTALQDALDFKASYIGLIGQQDMDWPVLNVLGAYD